MVTYCVLYQFTSAGMANVKELPRGIAEAHQAVEAMGGRVVACYVLMGQYDSVGIYEFPSDEVALAFLLGMGSRGVAKTTSLRAFTPEALAEVVKNVP
ncbi:MAG: GYD domain-containing protein [Anaerolineae bacterium]|nr:GYD domain-containing protein [Anaerolineae bacterium]